ncbi:hypothetical protein Patl1_21008 [Pistacia atlantica]|uniref:Uncharacterized protein n=1 Tax=Pistacia atlantica TaxID=434234 RepID=A0ACC1BIW7_9ROSI|nr:hypothetical protein Patl1_21008 [Pistacia atlantica]
MLAESRVRCILVNAKCIMKIVNEFGSFNSFMWGYVNYKPVINKYRYPRNVPLRTPKAEAISKDLLKRGFQFVGPVIVYSFIQTAGLTINWYSLTLFNLFILCMFNCCFCCQKHFQSGALMHGEGACYIFPYLEVYNFSTLADNYHYSGPFGDQKWKSWSQP